MMPRRLWATGERGDAETAALALRSASLKAPFCKASSAASNGARAAALISSRLSCVALPDDTPVWALAGQNAEIKTSNAT
jgi:hypothetical protein